MIITYQSAFCLVMHLIFSSHYSSFTTWVIVFCKLLLILFVYLWMLPSHFFSYLYPFILLVFTNLISSPVLFSYLISLYSELCPVSFSQFILVSLTILILALIHSPQEYVILGQLNLFFVIYCYYSIVLHLYFIFIFLFAMLFFYFLYQSFS